MKNTIIPIIDKDARAKFTIYITVTLVSISRNERPATDSILGVTQNIYPLNIGRIFGPIDLSL